MSRDSWKKAREAEARERAESAASYYELKTQAVEDLVSANEENSPPVSREETSYIKFSPVRLKRTGLPENARALPSFGEIRGKTLSPRPLPGYQCRIRLFRKMVKHCRIFAGKTL